MRLKHFNIMRLIYCALLALPFVAILSRVIYVQSNKNAYQSAEITQTTYDKVEIEDIYTFNLDGQDLSFEYTDNWFYGYIYRCDDSFLTDLFDTNDRDEIYFNGDSVTSEFEFFINVNITYDGLTYLVNFGDDIEENYVTFLMENDNAYTFDIKIEQYSSGLEPLFETSALQPSTNQYFNFVEVESTTLDNVFEYSLNKFIQDNNFGKLNLFQWTTNLFFDSNYVNNMYVGFINWYLNYTLLVSATYILFLVLMWFINYARRLLERGMNYDF